MGTKHVPTRTRNSDIAIFVGTRGAPHTHLQRFCNILIYITQFQFISSTLFVCERRRVRQMAEWDVLRFVKLFMSTLDYSGLELLTL